MNVCDKTDRCNDGGSICAFWRSDGEVYGTYGYFSGAEPQPTWCIRELNAV